MKHYNRVGRLKLAGIVFICAFAITSLFAETVPQFQSGDRWCAVGDSITHGGLYSRYIYLFYATRFPDREIDYFNGGIAGDTARGTLKRVESDILRHKPTVATIMLGMNDVVRGLYAERNANVPDIQKKRDAAIDENAASMKKLGQTLKAAGIRIIFITPSIFDDTAEMARLNFPGCNAALGRCAANDKKLAEEFKASIVDFHGPMTELNLNQQKSNPKFSIIGKDRVHPVEPGHFVMAYLFLKAQAVPKFVSDIVEDAAGKNQIEFTRKENALPFPVPEKCVPALKLVPFMEEMNQECLRVKNLPAGKYKLSIDDQPIHSFSAAELDKGINLAEFPSTPQCRQALEVAKVDEQRHEFVNRLRTIDYVEGMMGRKIGDTEAFDFAAAAGELKSGNPWVIKKIEDYLKFKPEQVELLNQLKDSVLKIRTMSQPQPHRFNIKKED